MAEDINGIGVPAPDEKSVSVSLACAAHRYDGLTANPIPDPQCISAARTQSS